MRIYECDVLVVGGGGAALRAAIAVKELDPDCRVTVVTKGKLGTTGTTANSCSDRMAFHATLPYTEPGGPDNWKYHADDIYRIGGKVSDYDLAVILAKNSADAFYYLDSLGVPFVKKDGKALQFVTDGSRYARACYTGPKTAIHIEEALVRRIAELDIDVVEYSMIFKLVVRNGKITGAYGVNEENEYMFFKTAAVVLGTGGAGEVFAHHVYPPGATGDGYALALCAGASLVNMEFIQIGLSSVKTKLACSGSLMRAVPRFVNDRGEEFLIKYFPRGTTWQEINNIIFEKGASWPVSFEHRSSQIDIAVFKELSSGRRVYLDYSQNPAGFSFDMLKPENKQRYFSEIQQQITAEKRQISPLMRLTEINPQSIEWLQENGICLKCGEKIEIVTAAQHFQGGVKIREHANTEIRGLFVAGECAGGQHGANRPGGNALMDCQVFGKIAGEETVRYAKSSKPGYRQEDVSFKEEYKKGGEIPASLFRQEVQKIMSRFASVIRTPAGLKEAWSKLSDLGKKGMRRDGCSLIFFYETKNLFEVARAIILSCMNRTESRGPHLYFRSEKDISPVPSDTNWEKYLVLRQVGGKLQINAKEPVRPPKQ